MKKMNAFIAAMALALAAVTPLASFADDQAAQPTTTGKIIVTPADAHEKSITLSQEYASSYTLYLPDEAPNLKAESPKIEVGMNAYLKYDQNLTVSVTSAHEWQLADTNTDNKSTVPYTLMDGETDITKAEGEYVVIDIIDAQNKQTTTKTLEFTHFEEAACAGTYEDTLTFKVAIAEFEQGERAAWLDKKAKEEAATTTAAETTAVETTSTTPVDPVE